eukprot:5652538-Amphidinium_carterae.1
MQELDLEEEESEREAKRQRRTHPLEAIPEETPAPYMEDETGEIEAGVPDERATEELLEGQWRDWI